MTRTPSTLLSAAALAAVLATACSDDTPARRANTGWSWHLEDVTFVEVAIELCDGRPSDVERAGVQFGDGHFCPWSATVVRID